MTTNADSTEEALRGEILEEARRQGEEIISRARQDAEASLAGAAAEADRIRQERLDRARTEAARRREMILATVPVEAGRLRAERVEAILKSVHEEVLGKLLTHDGFDYGETVVALASRAIGRMRGGAFRVMVSETDRTSLGDGLGERIERRAGREGLTVTVSYEPSLAGGGVVVEDVEAREMWDNRLARRLERMWPELRRLVAVRAAFVSKSETGGNGP